MFYQRPKLPDLDFLVFAFAANVGKDVGERCAEFVKTGANVAKAEPLREVGMSCGIEKPGNLTICTTDKPP